MDNFNLNIEHELIGDFWVIGSENHYPGILKYKNKEITITLSNQNNTTEKMFEIIEKHNDIVIYGISNNEKITCLNCRRNGVTSFGTNYTISKIVIGEHYENENINNIERLSINFSNINNWLCFKIIEIIDQSFRPVKFINEVISIKLPFIDSVELYHNDDIKICVCNNCIPSFCTENELTKDIFQPCIDIVFNKHKSINDLFYYIESIRKFMFILSNRRVFMNYINLQTPCKSLAYLCNFSNNTQDDYHKHDNILPYSYSKMLISKVVGKWFHYYREQELKPIIDLFVDPELANSDLNDRFFDNLKALEGIYNKYYKKNCERPKLSKKCIFMFNWLKDFYPELEQYLLKVTDKPDVQKACDLIQDERDFIAHGKFGFDYKDFIPSSVDIRVQLFWIIHLLLYTYILDKFGVDKNYIINRFRTLNPYKQFLEKNPESREWYKDWISKLSINIEDIFDKS